MLPSTGLFKELSCPYFDKAVCTRPYCHFKHLRKDDSVETPTVVAPEYKPGPKLLTLPQLTSFSLKTSRPQLEYQPEKPSLNASPSKKRSHRSPPVYIPASTTGAVTGNGQDNEAETSRDLGNCHAKLDEPSGMHEQSSKNSEYVVQEKTDEKGKISDCASRAKEPESKRKEERRDSTASSSSSTRPRHNSSSSKSKRPEESSSLELKSSKTAGSKNDSGKEKQTDSEKKPLSAKERDKDNNNKDCDKRSSSSRSSSSKHKSSSSRSSERHKERSSSRHKGTSSSSSKHHSDNHRGNHHTTTKTSSSSSSSRHKGSASTSSSSASKEKDTKNTRENSRESARIAEPEEMFECDKETATLFATTDEDIMKECEMIYDQLEEEFAALHKNDSSLNADEPSGSATKRKLIEELEADEQAAAAATHRKRVAYENADKYKSQMPSTMARKPNHIRNAMQAIFHRQAELRRKQEEEAAAAVTALHEAEEKVREANEALRKAKEKNLTPLIPKSYLTAPRIARPIAPVANLLALERAKKKVEELKAEKKPAFTPSQTRRSATRVAHTATAAATPIAEPEKVVPKPPVLEPNSTKISFNLRMQHYELMVKHCLAIYPDVPDAWQRAQTEELAIFKKCNTPVIYKSSCMLAINKLRKEAADSGNKPANNTRIISHEVILAGKLAQNTSWSVQKKMKTDATVGGEPFDKLPGETAYEMVHALHLTEEQLVANGYPRAGPRNGSAVMTSWRPMRRPNETERYCSRCGKVFNLDIYEQVCVDQCNYHPKSTGYRRGYADNQHRCCQQPAGTPGCTYANYHVSDYVDADNVTGYVTTIEKDGDYVPTKKDIYALDCEMCYTTHGIELTRVTVVDINARTVYDALVKPDNKIVDYNTVYSGITEEMMASETRSLRDVQAILMSMFHSNTVLLGHSLESDLKALKIIHSIVVDTSVLFPHKMGHPKKRALKTLCIENLKRIIQENEGGHDSAEDAEVCIQLVKFYLRNKIS